MLAILCRAAEHAGPRNTADPRDTGDRKLDLSDHWYQKIINDNEVKVIKHSAS